MYQCSSYITSKKSSRGANRNALAGRMWPPGREFDMSSFGWGLRSEHLPFKHYCIISNLRQILKKILLGLISACKNSITEAQEHKIKSNSTKTHDLSTCHISARTVTRQRWTCREHYPNNEPPSIHLA